MAIQLLTLGIHVGQGISILKQAGNNGQGASSWSPLQGSDNDGYSAKYSRLNLESI